MMPRPKVGLQRERAVSMERKDQSPKKDQRSDYQEETLGDRMTQALLEA